MLVEQDVQVVNVEVVGEAYDIAANYLKKTGAMKDTALINDRLLEIIASRPASRVVPTTQGAVEQAYQQFLAALARP